LGQVRGGACAMVGFGKRIKNLCEDRPEWSSYYVDYKSLKRLIKMIVACEDVEDAEEGFKLTLECEIAKVESFFRAKGNVFSTELRQLRKRVSQLDRHVEGAAECKTVVQLLELLQGQEEGSLLKDLLSFAKHVDDLREFVFANTQACIKINKKHDKNSKYKLREHYCGVLHESLFYTSVQFGMTICDAKTLVCTMMERLGGNSPAPEAFQCAMCGHVLSNPLALKCGHTVCLRCVPVSSLFKEKKCVVPHCGHAEFKFDHENVHVYQLLKMLQETRFTLQKGPSGPCFQQPTDHASLPSPPRGGNEGEGPEGATPREREAVPCCLAFPCARCRPVTPRMEYGAIQGPSFDEFAAQRIKEDVFKKLESSMSPIAGSRRTSLSSEGAGSPPRWAHQNSWSSNTFQLVRTCSSGLEHYKKHAQERLSMWQTATAVALFTALFTVLFSAYPSLRQSALGLIGLEGLLEGHCRKGDWGYKGDAECLVERELEKLQEERKKWLMKALDKVLLSGSSK